MQWLAGLQLVVLTTGLWRERTWLSHVLFEEFVTPRRPGLSDERSKPMETIVSALDLTGVMLVKDCMETPGGFLLLQALKLAVSRGHRILLLTVCHGASHYQQLLRKLGMNMPALMSSGQLVVLDVLHSLSQLAGTSEGTTGLDLRGTFSQVLAVTQGSTQPVSLVVDDLSVSNRISVTG